VIVPDGFLIRTTDEKLREFLKEECIIDGIISLPVDAFYRNSKKTYILAITKKEQKTEEARKFAAQTEPVYTYLVSNIGETLDVNRFPIEQNDLYEMVSAFNQFKGAKATYKANSKRCKIQPIEKFDPRAAWSVDRWWLKEEKVELGIEEENLVISFDEFKEKLVDVETELHEFNKALKAL
jgi:type I restriction enzyme M protein